MFPAASPATVPGGGACVVPCPVSYFRRVGGEVKGSAKLLFRKYMFLSLSFFSFSICSSFLLVPFDLPTANFSSILRAPVQCSFALRCFFFIFKREKRSVGPSLSLFFSNFFSLSACGISFHFKVCARARTHTEVLCFAPFPAPPLLTRPIARGFVPSLTF